MKTQTPHTAKKTKSGLVAALIKLGFSQSEGPFPPSLKTVAPAATFTADEMIFAEYMVADNDFGGCWNDAEQITMHCAPASPAHTPEPWTIRTATGNEGNGTYIHALTNGTEIKQHLLGKTVPEINANAARICACVNACAGMTDPEAEIRALRDALDSINRALSTPPLMTREAQEGFSYHSAEEAYRVELCRLIIETRDTARAALKGATK